MILSMLFSEAYAGTLSLNPLQGSDLAARWDCLYNFLLWLSAFFFVLIVGAMLYFTAVYKHKPGKKTKYIRDHHLLETIWIVVPTILLMIIFAWGYSVYHEMTQAPGDAYEIRVIGKQWLWTFQYDNGKTTVGDLYVPLNKPVKLIMTSEDVLHSFFIPNFRVKQDVVPGMYTSVWFTATVPGRHQVFCAEYCGTSHSQMLANVVALNDAQWEAWSRGEKLGEIQPASDEELAESGNDAGMKVSRAVQSQAHSQSRAQTDKIKITSAHPVQVSLVEQGRSVYQKHGCETCHSLTGEQKIGPSFKGLYGRSVTLANGKVISKADENYIRGHIENPRGYTVKGYSSTIMPTYKGLIGAVEMNALIEFIKNLK